MKIAIPDLETGDIIDYTVSSTLDWDMKTEGINFTPFIFSLFMETVAVGRVLISCEGGSGVITCGCVELWGCNIKEEFKK